MKWFEYAAPRSLAEAIHLLSTRPQARPQAGGTDLLVQLRSGGKGTDLVVDVKHISELNEIQLRPRARPYARGHGTLLPDLWRSVHPADLSGVSRSGISHRRHTDSKSRLYRRQPV